MFEREVCIPLPDDVFRLLRDYVYDYCGIFFDADAKYLLERRLSRRLKLLHMKDFKEYYRFLKYDRRRDEEMTKVVDVLTVNETYFFREAAQLRAFSREILPELKKENVGTRKLRIWSAGCSTGEEPYTLAILVLESGLFTGWDVQIMGSDINQRVLQAARRAVYRRNSFRVTEKALTERYFEEDGEGAWRVRPAARRLVEFSCLNLVDPLKIRLIETMDVVFCRNVFIYFGAEARKKVVTSFRDRLRPGGYLLLGHAESLMNISTDFRLRHFREDMAYQKPPEISHD